MGCLFACFGACKHRKHRALVNATTHFEPHRHEASEDVQVIEFTKKEEEIERPISLSREKQNSFDCNAVEKHEASEDVQVIEFTNKRGETEQSISMSREKLDEPIICSTIKKVTFDLDVKTNEESLVDNLVKDNEKEETPKETKLVSRVPNNRYQNCATSGDEYEDLCLEDSDLDDDSGGGNDLGSNEKILVQEESSESLFSLSIDSRKHVGEVELGEKEVNSPMLVRSSPIQEDGEMGLRGNGRDGSEYVCSVLNPVENLSQWKVVKARATPPPSKYQEKENVNLMTQELDGVVCPVQSFKLSTHKSVVSSNSNKVLDQEIAVDASLSSWLVESETTPMSETSTVSVGNSPDKPRNHEDKSILAALAVKELKQLSASLTSPRRSRSQSPDEPVIGTVGSYWSCTGKIMDSDSSSSSQGLPLDGSRNKEDERVKWDSVPFETRLDKALNVSIAEV